MKADSKANADKAKPNASRQNAPAAKSSASETGGSGREVGDRREGGSGGQVSAKSTTTTPNAQAGASAQRAGASVSLSTEQKTKIRTTVLQSSSAPKVSRSSINFNISVGTVVPRSVHFVSVPRDDRRDPPGVARLQLLHRR